MTRLRTFPALLLLVLWPFDAWSEEGGHGAVGDGGSEPDASGLSPEDAARQTLDQGLRLWRNRQPGAWMVIKSIPPETVTGREARERLKRADRHYQKSLDLLQQGEDEAAFGEIARGRETGPIDPHLYLEVGDIMRNRGWREQAVRYYGRYLAFMNQAGEPIDAETLRDITLYIAGGDPEFAPPPQPESNWTPLVVGAGVVVVALLASILMFLWRGRTLTELIDESPELHPRIAYAVGCLRHELLKHRLGALGDTVGVLRTRKGLTPGQLSYLRDRLFGGESLTRLWRIYLDTFDRLSGQRLNLNRRDREFRRAGQAVRTLEGLQSKFEQPSEQFAEKLEGLRQQISHFDRHLRSVADRLCRSRVDGQLLREAVFSVQGEPRAADIRLDEIHFAEPPPEVYVEVFRTDLLIVLRNLVRNAILALGRQESSARVLGLEVELRTEPTGDESVLIKVLDTSPELVTTADIYGRRLDHGLGLVAAAVTRYDGSVFVEPGSDQWRKAVVVRFFRSLGENG